MTVEDFPISKEIAGVNRRLTAGGIRELHGHAAAEWAIKLSGGAKTLGHYIENIGDTHLILLEMFRSDHFMDLSLSEWVSNTPNWPYRISGSAKRRSPRFQKKNL